MDLHLLSFIFKPALSSLVKASLRWSNSSGSFFPDAKKYLLPNKLPLECPGERAQFLTEKYRRRGHFERQTSRSVQTLMSIYGYKFSRIDCHFVIPTNPYWTIRLNHKNYWCCPLGVADLFNHPHAKWSNSCSLGPLKACGIGRGLKNFGFGSGFRNNLALTPCIVPNALHCTWCWVSTLSI